MLSGEPGAAGRMEPFGLGLLAVVMLGVALRALHLDIPMRYDESVTYMSYASRGWQHVTTSYQNPNNHVFHSLLVSWVTGLLGSAPWVIRLPAFLAGCALIPLTAWVGRLACGREAGLGAALLVATSPVLIEFSTNARGYSLMSMFVLLGIGAALWAVRGRGLIAWILLAEAGVLGLYTLPTMLLPWIGLTLWIGVGLSRRSPATGARAFGLLPLLATSVATLVVVAALYSGILVSAGLDALVGNRFVTPEPIGAFLVGAPRALTGVLAHWSRGVPWALGLVAAALGAAGLRPAFAGRPWSTLLGALAVGAAIGMLGARNWGEPRIWLWGLPLFCICIAVGATELASRVDARRARIALAFGAAWAALMTVQIIVAQPVRASTETGVFPEVVEVVEGITRDFRDGDNILSDFVSVEPVKFYLGRWAATQERGPASPVERVWVVVVEGDSTRTDVVRARLARLGIPPLESASPVFTVGRAAVFLFGRPAGAPNVLLLEAIDWHTGVAGALDEARARDLLVEASEASSAPLVRGWTLRCRSLGCMGLGPGEEVASRVEEVLPELRELALAGEPEAAFLLGWASDGGMGTSEGPAEAARRYTQAAAAGHVLAARLLGEAHAEGRGVTEDLEEAAAWWRRAAAAGDAVAQLRLAQAYEAGRGVTADRDRALAAYRAAAERGLPEAAAALARLGAR